MFAQGTKQMTSLRLITWEEVGNAPNSSKEKLLILQPQ